MVVSPVCRAEEREQEVLAAPWKSRSEGEFGVVVAEKGYKKCLEAWKKVLAILYDSCKPGRR
jgi:hypothetical protein